MITKPEYMVRCTKCNDFVKVKRVSNGIWAVNVENPECNACMRAAFRFSDFIDEHDDKTVMEVFEALTEL